MTAPVVPVTLGNFEEAVSLLFGPHGPARQRAEEWVLRNVSAAQFEQFFHQTGFLQVRFYCVMYFDGLLSAPGASAPDRAQERLTHIVPAILRMALLAGEGEHPPLDYALRNKLASVYAKCLTLDYLTHWPDALRDLTSGPPAGVESQTQLLTRVDFLNRVLAELDENVLSEHAPEENRQLASAVKDRFKLAGEWDRLFELWTAVLVGSLFPPGGIGIMSASSDVEAENIRQVKIACLKVIKTMVCWCELGKVWSREFFQVLGALLTGRFVVGSSPGPSSAGISTNADNTSHLVDPALFPASCEVLSALVERRMPAVQRIQALEMFGVVPLLLDEVPDPDNVAALEKKAEVVDSVAEVLLESHMELRRAASGTPEAFRRTYDDNTSSGTGAPPPSLEEIRQYEARSLIMVARVLPRISVYFAHENFTVANSVEEFLTAFFKEADTLTRPLNYPNLVGRTSSSSPTTSGPPEQGTTPHCPPAIAKPDLEQFAQTILTVFVRRIAYPAWFRHDEEELDDREHADFLEYRRDLERLLGKIFRISEDLVYSWIVSAVGEMVNQTAPALHQRISSRTSGNSGNNYEEQEAHIVATLHLLKKLVDAIPRELPQLLKNREHPLSKCLTAILQDFILKSLSSTQIQLELLDLYEKFRFRFEAADAQPELREVVHRYTQGILSGDAQVCKRACFSFNKFVKKTRSSLASVARDVTQSLSVCTTIKLVFVKPPDSAQQLFVCHDQQEHVFEALGVLATSVPSEHTQNFLVQVLQPAMRQMEGLVATTAPMGMGIAASSGKERGGTTIGEPPGAQQLPPGIGSHAELEWALGQQTARIFSCVSTFAKSFTKRQAHLSGTWESIFELCAKFQPQFFLQNIVLEYGAKHFVLLAIQGYSRFGEQPLVRSTFRILTRQMVRAIGSGQLLKALAVLFPDFYHQTAGRCPALALGGLKGSDAAAIIHYLDLRDLVSLAQHISTQFQPEDVEPFLVQYFDTIFGSTIIFLQRAGATVGPVLIPPAGGQDHVSPFLSAREIAELVEVLLHFLKEAAGPCAGLVCVKLAGGSSSGESLSGGGVALPRTQNFLEEVLRSWESGAELAPVLIAETLNKVVIHCGRLHKGQVDVVRSSSAAAQHDPGRAAPGSRSCASAPSSPVPSDATTLLSGLPLATLLPQLLVVLREQVATGAVTMNKLSAEIAALLRMLTCSKDVPPQVYPDLCRLVGEAVRNTASNPKGCEQLTLVLQEGGVQLKEIKAALLGCMQE